MGEEKHFLTYAQVPNYRRRPEIRAARFIQSRVLQDTLCALGQTSLFGRRGGAVHFSARLDALCSRGRAGPSDFGINRITLRSLPSCPVTASPVRNDDKCGQEPHRKPLG